MSDFAVLGCLVSDMQTKSDAQLLRDYAAHGSEPAFAGIVARHTDLVYSAAWRQTGSPELAREIAQSVFTDLARKARALAGGLTPEASLTGWLYRSTRYEVLTVLRDERRRQAHQRLVMEHFNPAAETAPDWQHIAPVLDEAMAELGDADRESLLLRYFQNQDFQAVGRALGVSDDAAQKRVGRAVERLREFLAQRGVTLGAHGLVVVFAANAVPAAPAGLSAALAAAALTGTTVLTTAAATVGKAIAMTTTQKVLVTAALAAAVGTGIYEAREASVLRTQIQTLQQQSPSSEQFSQLTQELNQSASQLAALRTENERLNSNTAELMRLRNEVTRLRTDATLTGNNPSEIAMKAWLNRVIALKQRLEQSPDQKIPELELLTEDDWLNVTRRELTTDVDYRRAFSSLRSAVEIRFGDMLSSALRKYLAANGNQFPTELSQLQPYFASPVNEVAWQRYAVLPAAEVGRMAMPKDKWVISQKAPVDEQFDSRLVVSQFAFGAHQNGGHWHQAKESAQVATDNAVMLPVMKAFMDANGGKELSEPAELFPYTVTEEQRVLLEKLIQKVNAAKAALAK